MVPHVLRLHVQRATPTVRGTQGPAGSAWEAEATRSGPANQTEGKKSQGPGGGRRRNAEASSSLLGAEGEPTGSQAQPALTETAPTAGG